MPEQEVDLESLFGKPPEPTQTQLRQIQMNQVLDLFGGALKGLWNTTLGGVVQTGKTFAKGEYDALKSGGGGPLLAATGAPGLYAVGRDTVKGAIGQGEQAVLDDGHGCYMPYFRCYLLRSLKGHKALGYIRMIVLNGHKSLVICWVGMV